MKLVILFFCVALPVFAQIDGGDPAFQRCRDRCDRLLETRQNIAESNFNITVNGCVYGNVGTCVGCLFLTAPPAVIACWVACGIVVPLTCEAIIESAWNRYVNAIVLAGELWSICLEECELSCT